MTDNLFGRPYLALRAAAGGLLLSAALTTSSPASARIRQVDCAGENGRVPSSCRACDGDHHPAVLSESTRRLAILGARVVLWEAAASRRRELTRALGGERLHLIVDTDFPFTPPRIRGLLLKVVARGQGPADHRFAADDEGRVGFAVDLVTTTAEGSVVLRFHDATFDVPVTRSFCVLRLNGDVVVEGLGTWEASYPAAGSRPSPP